MGLISLFLGCASDPSAGGSNNLQLVYSDTLVYKGAVPADVSIMTPATADNEVFAGNNPDQGITLPLPATKVRAWANFTQLDAASGSMTFKLLKNGVVTAFSLIANGPIAPAGLKTPAIVGTALVTYAAGDSWGWSITPQNLGVGSGLRVSISTAFFA